MKATKEQLVKDIFYEATNGLRSLSNFADGQILIELLTRLNYKKAIEKWWNEVDEGRNAYWVLNEMVAQTLFNSYGVKGTPTPTTIEIRKAFKPFKKH